MGVEVGPLRAEQRVPQVADVGHWVLCRGDHEARRLDLAVDEIELTVPTRDAWCWCRCFAAFGDEPLGWREQDRCFGHWLLHSQLFIRYHTKGSFFLCRQVAQPHFLVLFKKQGDHIPHKLTPEVKPEEQVDGCQLWVLKKYLVDRGVGQEPSELFGNGQFSLNFKALNCIPDVLNDVHFVSLNVLF